ncbi:fumarylacetoacetate hydrolase family protein [Alteromonas sp. ALT199]|uniref:fumarylacetoacetate hydrolase family protein n=1 Tax=unclassified Alteromonas TaxID=2614992 RepID=UPI0004514513|nr:fumarylacetoacetate hydrolase family protein [Alteromonas sp. ALT199]MBT3134980.1 fumarylacetoacetate hydrolase family protein [Alteromonas sp. ALT199]
MAYRHIDSQSNEISLPVSKVVCIGRNYLDHIQEMNSTVSEAPLLFMKPKAALCHMHEHLGIPTDKGDCHNELEVSVLLKSPLKNASDDEVKDAIWGIGLGLDLTLREVQAALKKQGQPWERAKSFDNSAPLSGFVPLSKVNNIDDLRFNLTINDEVRQQGHTKLMLHKIIPLIAHMSSIFSLDSGDVILTGTPKGVGKLSPADKIAASLDGHLTVKTEVVAE